jgi:multimeric flavodoxin WrbA
MPSASSSRALKALALNCSLKKSRDREKSSTEVLLQQFIEALAEHDVEGETVRAADHNVLPGVAYDEGRGDAWPKLCKRVLQADILVLGTPIWLGQSSSIAKRVLERMDAFIHDLDDNGRMKTFRQGGAGCGGRQRGWRASRLGRVVSGAQ